MIEWLTKQFKKGNIMEDKINHEDLENLEHNEEIVEEVVEETVEHNEDGGFVKFKGKWIKVD